MIRRLPNWAILPPVSAWPYSEAGVITICDQFNISATSGKTSDAAITRPNKADLSAHLSYTGVKMRPKAIIRTVFIGYILGGN